MKTKTTLAVLVAFVLLVTGCKTWTVGFNPDSSPPDMGKINKRYHNQAP